MLGPEQTGKAEGGARTAYLACACTYLTGFRVFGFVSRPNQRNGKDEKAIG